MLLNVHIKNYMANRTTNERFSRKAPKNEEDGSEESSSVMGTSDFENSA
jgi:hypothetical protein